MVSNAGYPHVMWQETKRSFTHVHVKIHNHTSGEQKPACLGRKKENLGYLIFSFSLRRGKGAIVAGLGH